MRLLQQNRGKLNDVTLQRALNEFNYSKEDVKAGLKNVPVLRQAKQLLWDISRLK